MSVNVTIHYCLFFDSFIVCVERKIKLICSLYLREELYYRWGTRRKGPCNNRVNLCFVVYSCLFIIATMLSSLGATVPSHVQTSCAATPLIII